jgi:hypothetical protein
MSYACGIDIALNPVTGISEPSLRQGAVGTAHFEPGGVSFRHGGRKPMAKKVLDTKWQPKPLWTVRSLAELSAEVDRLRKKVRVAEAAVSKSTAQASELPSRHAAQVDKQPTL